MGQTGCIRPWRITAQVLGCQDNGLPYETWQTLLDKGLVQRITFNQHTAGWHYKQGRRRQLLALSPTGQQWYRQETGLEPKTSEWNWVLSRHSSRQHALAILEARDHLQAMGIPVDDHPFPCPVQMEEPFGKRSEPDLAIYYQQRVFPVEVQREIRIHHLAKWFKSLELFHRLMLITFSLSLLDRQFSLLSQARQQEQLPSGPILISSLESLEQGDHDFLAL